MYENESFALSVILKTSGAFMFIKNEWPRHIWLKHGTHVR